MGEAKPLTAYQQTYHWRNKNCGPWAQDWIKQNLPGLKVEEGKLSGEIKEVTSVTGDCDLGQRKGKLLTIYDLEVDAKWTGIAEDGSEVSGKLRVPEVSHEAIDGLSDYVFEFSLTSDEHAASSQLLSYLRKAFPPILKEKFNALRPALLAVHGQPSESTDPASGTSTPTPAASGSYTPAPPAKAPEPEKKKEVAKKSISTATVEIKAQLHASADDIWGLLTDEAKIPMWSRSAAKMSLTPDSQFELFGGNVRGKVVSAEAPKRLVQSWQPRMPNWPVEHYGTLTISLDQGSDSTAVTFTLDGVPTGQEADTEKALDTFYIRGLKQMGLVISNTSRSYPTPRRQVPPPVKKMKRKAKITIPSAPPSSQIIGTSVVIVLVAVFIGVVASSFRS